MRVTVAALVGGEIHGADVEIVVLVVIVLRDNALQKPLHIRNQQGLVFVEDDAGRCMPRLNARNSSTHL